MRRVRACRECAQHLPLGPRPIVQAHPEARVLIAGQAPGRAAHEAGRPFMDASGRRLREWMGLDERAFYDAKRIAIVPMGFCYPGRGTGGDAAPRPECAPLWREAVLGALRNLRLTLAIGVHAQRGHCQGPRASVAERARAWMENGGDVIALPHPSPRNHAWRARHPWFERELVPALRERVRRALA